MIPDIGMAERYGKRGLDDVKHNISEARQARKQKGQQQQGTYAI
jgi:hypothetical protein